MRLGEYHGPRLALGKTELPGGTIERNLGFLGIFDEGAHFDGLACLVAEEFLVDAEYCLACEGHLERVFGHQSVYHRHDNK